jgi:LAO/AO transport system kinase
MKAAQPDVARLARGIRAGERAVIARAITLIESRRADHRRAARQLLQDLLPDTGHAVRLGITGAPGVGKSTTIDALGRHLTAQGRKVAVLAVDPSSSRTGGSILADKTRMAELAADPSAFVRGRHKDTRVHARLRGGGLRCGAGRDHGHRPVRDHGRGHDRLFSGADAARRGR